MCVCVCVCEREREGGCLRHEIRVYTLSHTHTLCVAVSRSVWMCLRESLSMCVCVSVCMCERAGICAMKSTYTLSSTHTHFCVAISKSTEFPCGRTSGKWCVCVCVRVRERTRAIGRVFVPWTVCTYSQLQMGWHRILRFFLKTFNLVPGFSRGLSLVPFIRWYKS